MDVEGIIKKCLLGPGSRIKVKNDNKFYYVKNISPDRTNVFVVDDHNTVFRKKIANIVNCGNTKLNENPKEIIKKLIQESARDLKIKFRSYEDANRNLGDRSSMKLDRVVSLHRRDNNEICVKYYDTDVVCFNELGNIKVRNGGWQTMTTLQIINQFMPPNVSIFQRKGEWYVKGSNGVYDFHNVQEITTGGDIIPRN